MDWMQNFDWRHDWPLVAVMLAPFVLGACAAFGLVAAVAYWLGRAR